MINNRHLPGIGSNYDRYCFIPFRYVSLQSDIVEKLIFDIIDLIRPTSKLIFQTICRKSLARLSSSKPFMTSGKSEKQVMVDVFSSFRNDYISLS